MYQERILASFELDQPKAYTPQFRITVTDLGFEIWDDGHQIGFFNTHAGDYWLDFWAFSPFEAPIIANREPNPHVRDMHTLRNTFLNFPWTTAKDMLANVAKADRVLRLEWVQDSGDHLRWRLRGQFPQRQRMAYDFRLSYEPAWGRYRLHVDADAWKVRPEGFEPINMMMVGALHSRGEKRRWTHSVWEDPNGNLRRLVHSNALFSATDYGMDPDGPRRTKNAPTSGAWIAYATHPDFNPAMVVHACNVPLSYATCSQLFDEHMLWRDAGVENLDDTHFHFVMHTELVNLTPELARELCDAAVDPTPPRQWLWERCALPFRMGVVNSLEAPVDVWAPEDCPILVVDTDPAAPVAWVEEQSRSGHHSLRLQGGTPGAITRLSPSGAVCNVDPGKRYTFSAWVRTEGVSEGVRLSLWTYRYTLGNVTERAESATVVKGNSDWTFVSVALDSGHDAYMNPCLELLGPGRAYFDDLIFTEEAKGRSAMEDTVSLGPLPAD